MTDVIDRSYWPRDQTQDVAEVTVGGLLRSAAEMAPGAQALVGDEAEPAARRRWTYRELLGESEAVAATLLDRFAPGDRVALWAPTSPEWVIIEFAAALAGLTIVTVNPAFKSEELEYALKQSRAAGVILRREYRGNQMLKSLTQIRSSVDTLREVILLDNWEQLVGEHTGSPHLPIVHPDDIAQIQYTSGTTGFPKGAMLHHRGLCNVARFTAQKMGIDSKSVWINILPMFHTGGSGLATLGVTWFAASQITIGRFDARVVLDLFESEGGTHTLGPPTMMISMLEDDTFPDRDLSSVKCLQIGGTSVPPELIRKLEQSFGAWVSIGYGQTEASPEISATDLEDTVADKANTIGRPLPQVEVKLVDDSGETVLRGQEGEICVRGYQVMQGYFAMPEETAAAIDNDGWLHTSDIGSMDDRGYLTFCGRIKEVIIRGGENIYPREIEEAVLDHPAVADVAVVGIPDPKWGEVIGAFVKMVPERNVTTAELRDYLRSRLAPHKTPQHWIFVDKFPLTASGKVKKNELVANLSE